jgi:hypothetical protein
VAPVFEQAAPASTIGQGIEIGGPVGSEPGEAGQGMGAGNDVDAVDLEHAERIGHAGKLVP